MGDPHSVSFMIGIYSDIPARVHGYSMPGDCLWVKEFQPGDFIVSYEDREVKGWLSPPAAYWYPCCEIEDGVIFTTVLVAGDPAQVNIDMTVCTPKASSPARRCCFSSKDAVEARPQLTHTDDRGEFDRGLQVVEADRIDPVWGSVLSALSCVWMAAAVAGSGPVWYC